MAKYGNKNFSKIKETIKQKKGRPIIFSKKGWIIFITILVLLLTTVGVGTWYIRYRQEKFYSQRVARETKLYGDNSGLLFESSRIPIPTVAKGIRSSKASLYRVQREKWSQEQIMGLHGEGEWTDPKEISSDIFSEKNDTLMRDLFSSIE